MHPPDLYIERIDPDTMRVGQVKDTEYAISVVIIAEKKQ
jgi:hypothetical protein